MAVDCANTACVDPLATCSNHSYGIDCECLPGTTFTHGPSCSTCLPLPHITDLDDAGDLETSAFLRGWIVATICLVLFTSTALLCLFRLFRSCYPSTSGDRTKKRLPMAGFGWNSFSQEQDTCDFAHGNMALFALGFILYEATIHGAGLYTNKLFFITHIHDCRFHSIGIGVGLLLMSGAEARRVLHQVLWVRYLKALHRSSGVDKSFPSHHDFRFTDQLTWMSLWIVILLRVVTGLFDEETRSCCYRPLAWNDTDVTFLSIAASFWLGTIVCLALLLTDTIVWNKEGFVAAFMTWSLFGSAPQVEVAATIRKVKINVSGCNITQWIMSIGWSFFLSMWMIAVLVMNQVAYGQLRKNASYHRLSGIDPLFKGEVALVMYWLWTLATLIQWHIFYTVAVTKSTTTEKKKTKRAKKTKRKDQQVEEKTEELALSPLAQLAKRVNVPTLVFTADLETLFAAARLDNAHFWDQENGAEQANELFQSGRDDVQKALMLMAVVDKNKKQVK